MSETRHARCSTADITPSPAPDIETAAYTIAEFCVAHRIGRSKLYQLWAEGKGPRRMYVGSKPLISREAAAEWRRQMEEGG